MFFGALLDGQRPTAAESLGLAIALGGLLYLVLPVLDTPTPWAALLMMAAGISWGIYSLRGRGASSPVAGTRDNFLGTLPLVIVLLVFTYPSLQLSIEGILYAIGSGAIASAMGYVVWYAALQELNAKHAALVQLTVPILASVGGVLFLSESLTQRLLLAAILIIGGIAFAMMFPDLASRLRHKINPREVKK